MSAEISTEEGSEDVDILRNVVKDLQFLKYEHSIEQMKPSRFHFRADTEYPEVHDFSEFGQDAIKDFLHIGIISEDCVSTPVNRNQILLIVWPRFVSPTAYVNHKAHLPRLKKITTLIFQVPGSVFREYSEDSVSLNEIVAAAAVLTPVEEWKLLERMVISSFYHLMFDKPTTDAHGDINVWQNFSKDKLDKGWKQLLFICCGPQGLAFLIKRMLKRNWAKIVREATSMYATSNDGYNVFCTGGAVQLLIEWAKFSFKQHVLVKFLEEINSIKPAINLNKIIEKARNSFAQHVASSKRHRCTVCPYEADNKSYFKVHLRKHTGERPFVCEVCNQAFSIFYHLNRHKIIRHTGKYPYQCEYCGKPFIDKSSKKYHVASGHEKNGTLYFRCYKCLHIFKDETVLKDHMPSHSNDPVYECTVCLKKLDSETALLAHSRIHDKEKPFNCHICKRGFLTTSHLTSHYNIHSDSPRSFPCRFCNNEFKSSFSQRRHEASKHEEQSMV